MSITIYFISQLAEQEEKLRREEEEIARRRRSRAQNQIPGCSQGTNTAATITAKSINTAESSKVDPWESGDNSEWNVQVDYMLCIDQRCK